MYGLESEEAPVIYRFEDRIKAGIFGGLEMDFGGLKAALRQSAGGQDTF